MRFSVPALPQPSLSSESAEQHHRDSSRGIPPTPKPRSMQESRRFALSHSTWTTPLEWTPVWTSSSPADSESSQNRTQSELTPLLRRALAPSTIFVQSPQQRSFLG